MPCPVAIIYDLDALRALPTKMALPVRPAPFLAPSPKQSHLGPRLLFCPVSTQRRGETAGRQKWQGMICDVTREPPMAAFGWAEISLAGRMDGVFVPVLGF